MGGRRPIGPVDTIWLNMDRPDNLMVIDSVMWFEDSVDYDRLKQVVQHRLVDRYPVFRQRPVESSFALGQPHWEDDPAFTVERHLRRTVLVHPGDELALQRYVEAQMHRPLDRNHPLWEIHLVDGYAGGSAVVTRFHHSLADGIALAQVMLSLSDETPTADLEEAELDHPRPARRKVARKSDGSEATGAAELAPVDETGDAGGHHPVLGAAGKVTGSAGKVTGSATSAARGALHLLGGLPHLMHPGFAVDAFTLAQQTSHIANKLLLGSNPTTPLSGPPGLLKRAVWSAPRPLDDVKFVGRLAGATVNDVLVGAVSGAISEYLVDHGIDVQDLTTMIPVNLRPPDKPLPRELGNQFALVMLPLPTGTRSPLVRLTETKRRMDSIKHSPEAVLTFGIINALGRTRPEIERFFVDFFAAKAIGVTTNVAGPPTGRYVAGSRIAGALGWVPGSGNQTLGVCIFTYDRTVRVGFKADATAVPDPEKLVHAFDQEMDELLRMAKAV